MTQEASHEGAAPLRVVKFGGSLLDWDAWPRQLRGWLRRQPPAASVLVVGGGALADVVRGWDRTYRLDPTTAHQLAIGTMSVTARLAAQLLSEATLVERCESLHERLAEGSDSLIILDPWDFLQRVEPVAAGRRLPHGWHVTSDSIAARLAVVLGSAELVLLKSSLPPPEAVTLGQAAQINFVDAFLPEAAAEISRVRCVNLRADDWPEWIARHDQTD